MHRWILAILLMALAGRGNAEEKAKVLVVPDQYSTIQSAIDAANSGDSVYIRSGAYPEALILKSGVELVGSNRDEVLVRANALDQAAISGENLTNASVQHITFEHFGGSTADSNRDTGKALIRFSNSSINFTLCRVKGSPVDGLNSTGGSTAISDCEFSGNKWAAVCVTNDAKIYVYNSTITKNMDGIQIYNESTGKVMQNTVSQNGQCGIRVTDSSPALLYNRCDENQVGIWVGKGGAPLLQGNACSKNTNSGILASEKETKPKIRSNVCNYNGRFGIWVEEATYPSEFSDNKTSSNSVSNVMRRGYWRY